MRTPLFLRFVQATPRGGWVALATSAALAFIVLPVLHLAKLFPPQKGVSQGSIAVIVEADGNYAALVVDELVGQQQVVVKSLETNFHKIPGLSGATVMGDGSVALILDVSHIVRISGRQEALL